MSSDARIGDRRHSGVNASEAGGGNDESQDPCHAGGKPEVGTNDQRRVNDGHDRTDNRCGETLEHD